MRRDVFLAVGDGKGVRGVGELEGVHEFTEGVITCA